MKVMKKWTVFIILAAIFLIWLVASNRVIETSNYTITSTDIPDAFDNYTIVQISDLHNARFGKSQQVLCNKVRKQNPNIIVLTGDLIDSSHTNIDTAMEFVEHAMDIAPVYFVTGNHKAWSTQYTDLREKLENAGVNILDNRYNLIHQGDVAIALIGLQDLDI